MRWKKSGNETSVEEYFQNRIGTPEDAKRDECFEIPGVSEFTDYIKYNKDAHYLIIGDYDADGVTATSVMKIGLEEYFRINGVENTVDFRIPKRFTEGYGISEGVIEDIPKGVTVITVDNGISAIDEIRRLKEEGDTVLLTDHHLPVVIEGKTVLPEADVLIDPHVKDSGFKDYCGAGIAYKIMQELLPEDDPVLPLLNAWAAIGTVADVVPLKGENRTIVRNGLKVLNREYGVMTRGLKYLISGLRLWDKRIESDTIAFYIAPALTAVSRLSDEGAVHAVSALIDNSKDASKEKAEFLISENERRKKIVENALKQVQKSPELEKSADEVSFPLILKADAGEGIIGLIASKLCESLRGPVIVFTENEYDEGRLTGSARSMENCHIKELFDRHREFFIRYGGHANAAGCSIAGTDLEALKDALQEDLKDVVPMERLYDLELDPAKAMDILQFIQNFRPFGQGNEEPVFHVSGRVRRWNLMGANDAHIRFTFDGLDVVMFNCASRFDTLHMAQNPVIDVYGRLSLNEYRGSTSAQIIAMDVIVN